MIQTSLHLYGEDLGSCLSKKATKHEYKLMKKTLQERTDGLDKEFSQGLRTLVDALRRWDPSKGRRVEIPLLASALGIGLKASPGPNTVFFQTLGFRRWIEAWWTNRGLNVAWKLVLRDEHEESFRVSFPKDTIHILQGPSCDVFVMTLSW
jgi:hypothetical protein